MTVDVLQAGPALFRRLRQRFHYQIAGGARGGLCNALRGQVPQELGTAERAVPGAERGDDAGADAGALDDRDVYYNHHNIYCTVCACGINVRIGDADGEAEESRIRFPDRD